MSLFLPALLIFSLRIVDVSLAIIRILMVLRGLKLYSWIAGFFQALVFVIAIRQIMADLGNWYNMIGYAMGFATGTAVGVWIEEQIAAGYGHIRIISPRLGASLTEAIRNAGYAVTLIPGRGRDGAVDILSCSVPRRQVRRLKKLIIDHDPDAFITVENVRPLHRGFWPR